jgi:hypothetical protein
VPGYQTKGRDKFDLSSYFVFDYNSKVDVVKREK